MENERQRALELRLVQIRAEIKAERERFDDGLPSVKDTEAELRAVGLTPGEVGRTLRQRLLASLGVSGD